jgi:sugar phosphate isomerase/epimerase
MTLPVIGAALPVDALETYRDWLFEKDRDLELQSFHDPAMLASDAWQDAAEAANAALSGFKGRLGIHGPFWGLHLSNPDPEIRGIIRRRLDTGLDICGAVGATQMVIHSPYTTWDHNNLDNHANARQRVTEAVHDSLGAAVTRAADMGVTLVLENIEDKDPEERKRLVQSFGSDALKLSIDTGHAHYAHGSTGAPPVDYYVKSAGSLLAHVHLQDADGYADRHWSIGQGTIRWHAVFAALAALEVKPHLVLELRDKDRIPASMAWLEAQGLGQ